MNGTLHQIAQELAAALERLEKGDLQLEEVGPLTDQARELYERLVALRYVAIERLVKPSEGKEGAFRLNDIHPNQTSLIDAIEEVSKLEDVKKEPQVIQEQLFAPVFDEVEEEVEDVEPELDVTAPEPEEPLVFDEETNEEPEVDPETEDEKEPEAIEEQEEEPQEEEPPVSAEPITESKHALQQDQDDSLAQKLRKTPIDDLRKAIGLNQKFLLINELFGGDADTYNASVDQLNGSSNFSEASNWIDAELRGQFEWDNESTTVQEFLDLVERRFL
ncbi:MAG: hypothetical protein P8H59_00740 [Flavobacteriales bacterium]|nr:hypothetical protein [Flavobacteriales bacterium]MDG1779448.1 hypothetical protein [Flavobacteriales bacterium]MDG2245006.1 hypothetical protein [Flavobacteriales bacterium]